MPDRRQAAVSVLVTGITAALLAHAFWYLMVRVVCRTPMLVPYTMCEFASFFGWPLSLGLIIAAYGYWRARGMVEQLLIVSVACLSAMFAIGSLIHAVRLNSPEAGGSFFQEAFHWLRALPEIFRSWGQHTLDAITDVQVLSHLVKFTFIWFFAACISLFVWRGLFWLLFPRRSAHH